jgi:protocatechuate 3,4-dioxygenase beta subunit
MPHDQQRERRGIYEGRSLPRPHEEIVDQGLGFDVQTILARRQALRLLGIGAAALGLAACGVGSGNGARKTAGGVAEIPPETAGPFPGNGSNGPDVLEQSGVIRSDIRSSFGDYSGTADGVPMTLDLILTDLARGGASLTGAAVYVWQCDREARYSLYSPGAQDQNYLRGVQIADDGGRVRFTSVFPACYAGRWPHIHFEVYPDRPSISDAGNVIATSQVALPEKTCKEVYARPGYEGSERNLSRVSLEGDIVFADDGGASQLATVTGDVSSGYAVSLVVGVDPTTA